LTPCIGLYTDEVSVACKEVSVLKKSVFLEPIWLTVTIPVAEPSARVIQTAVLVNVSHVYQPICPIRVRIIAL
jgi:hypothetical protein